MRESRETPARNGQPVYRIETKVARGYEIPEWHRPEHGSLESAQGEVTKLRQWDPDRRAIKDLEIREA